MAANSLSTRPASAIWKFATYAILICAVTVVLFPMIWMISTSLKPDVRAVFTLPPDLIPKPPTWSNYLVAWQSAPFVTYTLNSVFIALSSTILQLFTGCLAAYVFARFSFRGRDFLFFLYLTVMMVPVPATVVPLYVLMSQLKWLNSYASLILPFAANAFGIFLVRQAFLNIPRDMLDACAIDGASDSQTLRNIMIPLSMPAIITFALLTFKWRWSEYFWVIIMTSTDAMRTLPVGVVALQGGPEGSAWQIVMAAVVIALAPIMALFMLAQRYFVESVAQSGLKF